MRWNILAVPDRRGLTLPGRFGGVGRESRAVHPERVICGTTPPPRLTTSPHACPREKHVAKHENDTLYVIAAAYDDVDAAIADYEAVKALYREVQTSHDFDASVIAKGEDGKVRIVRKHEQPTRHGAAVGLGWGLAVGVTALLFPPVGIGLVTAGATGAVVGGVAGHASGGMSRSDLKDLGEVLDAGQAGLIAVYAANLADQVAANIKAANRVISRATDMAADQLAADMRQAETEAETETAAVPPQAPRSPEATETKAPTEG
jgi:uncharacterized membrane protein